MTLKEQKSTLATLETNLTRNKRGWFDSIVDSASKHAGDLAGMAVKTAVDTVVVAPVKAVAPDFKALDNLGGGAGNLTKDAIDNALLSNQH